MPAEISAETIALLSKLVAGSKFQEAAKICERLTAASPDDARGWRTLLKCYVELGEFRRAFLTMDRMLERHPWEDLYCFRTYFGVDGYLGVELQRRRDFTYFLLTVVIGVCIAEIGGRFGPIAALFSLAGCVVLALLVELGARARAGCRFGLRGEGVLAPFGKANPFVFYVADSQLYKYDDIFGFHYVAQQKWVQVAVGQDGIIDRRRLSSDRHGNLHPTDEEFESHTLNIAVIGDSFTCLPGNGDQYAGAENVEWPYIMKVFLDQKIGVGKTRVMNFGRVSNGILQMMKSAAQKAAELKPDLLIIAFLTRDMERPLRYVSPLNIAGTIRQYMHHERDELPDFLRAQEMGQIDARAAQELGSDEEVDFLRDVRARYATVLRRLSGRMFRLRDMHRSVLLDELVTGTVFTAFDLPPLDYKPTIRSIDVTSYDQNSEFQEIFDTLNACDVPVIFVHLPEAQEMKTKTFVPHSAVGGQLLGSFKKLIKKPVYFLSQYIDLPPEEIDKKFDRTDYDFHPSLWTKTVYADLITQLVLNECKANETMRSKAGLNNVA